MSGYEGTIISPMLILIVLKNSAVHDLVEASKEVDHGSEVVRGRSRQNSNITMTDNITLVKLRIAIEQKKQMAVSSTHFFDNGLEVFPPLNWVLFAPRVRSMEADNVYTTILESTFTYDMSR